MPLEAMRLGCEATALDLNPVAYLALVGSLVYPQRFGKGDTETRRHGDGGTEYAVRTKEPLAEPFPGIEKSLPVSKTSRVVADVRYWAAWVLDQAEAQIGACYPVDADGAVPAAYLWAKTIRCPHCGGEVPLIKRRWLAQTEGDEPVAYRLVADAAARRYTVEILRGDAAVRSAPERGTMAGATAECIYCGTPSERERIVAQAQAGEMGQHLLAVVLYRAGQTAATSAPRPRRIALRSRWRRRSWLRPRPRATTSGASSGCSRWCPMSRCHPSVQVAFAHKSMALLSGVRCSATGKCSR